MEDQFNKLDIPATRIKAVNGNNLSDNRILEIKKDQPFLSHYSSPRKGEIGAFLSHYKAWQKISEQTEDFGIVLEDDVRLNEQLINDLPKIISMMKNKDIVDISGRKGFCRSEKFKKNKNHELIQFNTPPLGMLGKIIGKDAAKYLFKNNSKYRAPVDVMLQKTYQHKLEIWSVNEEYVTHNDRDIGGSTIQNNKKIAERINRELKRPFWRLGIIFRNLIKLR